MKQICGSSQFVYSKFLEEKMDLSTFYSSEPLEDFLNKAFPVCET